MGPVARGSHSPPKRRRHTSCVRPISAQQHEAPHRMLTPSMPVSHSSLNTIFPTGRPDRADVGDAVFVMEAHDDLSQRRVSANGM